LLRNHAVNRAQAFERYDWQFLNLFQGWSTNEIDFSFHSPAGSDRPIPDGGLPNWYVYPGDSSRFTFPAHS
jgi:hypothetical protein